MNAGASAAESAERPSSRAAPAARRGRRHERYAADGDRGGWRRAEARRRATPPRDRLCALPFRAMTPTDVEQCAALARAIAARVHGARAAPAQPRTTGRLDFRRTIRAAVPRGGVPFERRYPRRRPARPIWWRSATCRSRRRRPPTSFCAAGAVDGLLSPRAGSSDTSIASSKSSSRPPGASGRLPSTSWRVRDFGACCGI
jgi:hypothetical protein